MERARLLSPEVKQLIDKFEQTKRKYIQLVEKIDSEGNEGYEEDSQNELF